MGTLVWLSASRMTRTRYGSETDDDSYPSYPPPNYSEGGYTAYSSDQDLELSEESRPPLAYGEGFGTWNDVLFAIGFFVHLVLVAVILVMRWDDTIVARGEIDGVAARWLDKDLLTIWVGVAFVGVVFAFAWMLLSRAAARVLIPVCMVGYVVLLVTLAIVLFAMGGFLYAIIFLVIAAFYAWVFWSWRSKIGFSAAMLRSSTTWVFDHSSTLVLSAAMLVVLILWVVIWIITVSAPLADGMESAGEFGLVVYLLFSLYWVTQVIRNVQHVAVAGTMMATYNAAKGEPAPSPLLGALRRATTTSFGSVCFGSLVVAILKTIRSLIRFMLNASDNQFLAFVINCILGCIESLMEIFNQYAFSEVAFGKSYIRAAKDTWDLLKSHGVAGIINEVLTGLTFFFGALMGAIVCGGVAAIWASSSSSVEGDLSWVSALVGGAILGYILVAQVLDCPDSYITATLVSLAEDPLPLPAFDPALAAAFREDYGFLIPAQAFRDAERRARAERRRQ